MYTHCSFAFSPSRCLWRFSKKSMFSLMESSFSCRRVNSAAFDWRAEFTATTNTPTCDTSGRSFLKREISNDRLVFYNKAPEHWSIRYILVCSDVSVKCSKNSVTKNTIWVWQCWFLVMIISSFNFRPWSRSSSNWTFWKNHRNYAQQIVDDQRKQPQKDTLTFGL